MSLSRPPRTAGVAALPRAVQTLAQGPAAELAVLVDFDGTLAPIVGDPAAARPDAAARAALAALTAAGASVACITGRPALQARELLALPLVTYSGLHGAELLLPGRDAPMVPAAFAADGEAVAGVLAAAQAQPGALDGLEVEHKGPIIALHWRRSDDPAGAAERARRIGERAAAAGLRVGAGRAVLELRPAMEISKGDAVLQLLERMPAAQRALFAGDDLTDLDAFDAVRRQVAGPRLQTAVLVAVQGVDAPPQVAAASDLTLESPAALGQLLDALATTLVGASA